MSGGIGASKMKKYFLIIVLTLFLAGCRDGVNKLSPTSTVPGSTPNASKEPDWLVYRLNKDISIEYPNGWTVEPENNLEGTDAAWFHPTQSDQASIKVESHLRPLAERSVADPQTWIPNEGGYEIHWTQPVTAGDLTGQMLVWGVKQNDEWDMPPWMMAMFYNETLELDIRLTTEFTPQSLETVQSSGFGSALADHFSIFQHMAEHIRMDKSGDTVTLAGIIQSGSDLGEAKSHCPEGLYLTSIEGEFSGKLLLLRNPGIGGAREMFTDRNNLGRPVTVTGVYPAQDFFCEALICDCEDYILVEKVEKQ
jgi:hypothetical protein